MSSPAHTNAHVRQVRPAPVLATFWPGPAPPSTTSTPTPTPPVRPPIVCLTRSSIRVIPPRPRAPAPINHRGQTGSEAGSGSEAGIGSEAGAGDGTDVILDLPGELHAHLCTSLPSDLLQPHSVPSHPSISHTQPVLFLLLLLRVNSTDDQALHLYALTSNHLPPCLLPIPLSLPGPSPSNREPSPPPPPPILDILHPFPFPVQPSIPAQTQSQSPSTAPAQPIILLAPDARMILLLPFPSPASPKNSEPLITLRMPLPFLALATLALPPPTPSPSIPQHFLLALRPLHAPRTLLFFLLPLPGRFPGETRQRQETLLEFEDACATLTLASTPTSFRLIHTPPPSLSSHTTSSSHKQVIQAPQATLLVHMAHHTFLFRPFPPASRASGAPGSNMPGEGWCRKMTFRQVACLSGSPVLNPFSSPAAIVEHIHVLSADLSSQTTCDLRQTLLLPRRFPTTFSPTPLTQLSFPVSSAATMQEAAMGEWVLGKRVEDGAWIVLPRGHPSHPSIEVLVQANAYRTPLKALVSESHSSHQLVVYPETDESDPVLYRISSGAAQAVRPLREGHGLFGSTRPMPDTHYTYLITLQKLSVVNKSSGEIELECSLDADTLSELAFSRLLVIQTALTVYILRPILPSSTLSGKPIQWSTCSLPSDARRIVSAAVSDENTVSLATRNSIDTLTLEKLPDHQFTNALSACISLGRVESFRQLMRAILRTNDLDIYRLIYARTDRTSARSIDVTDRGTSNIYTASQTDPVAHAANQHIQADSLRPFFRLLTDVPAVDSHGLRYLRHQYMRADCKQASSRCGFQDVFWAAQSDHQAQLLQRAHPHDHKMLWSEARDLGLFLWHSNDDALRNHMENIGRTHYFLEDARDPTSCSLFYLCLGKKKLLADLWRQASWHTEQSAMLKFLANDFDDPRWKSAAQKNAFALMSKQRFEYAAAFFILADRIQDAINVCVKNLGDWQLAIALARVYGKHDDNETFQGLLKDVVIPLAKREHHQWLELWAIQKQNVHKTPLPSFKEQYLDIFVDIAGTAQRHDYSPDHPALLEAFDLLRRQYPNYASGPAEATQVTRCVSQLTATGCSEIALAIARDWKFIHLRRLKRLNSGLSPMSIQVAAASQDDAQYGMSVNSTAITKKQSGPMTVQEFDLGAFGF